MQETQVPSLAQEDPTCRGATKPKHRDYWAHSLERMLCSKRSRCNKKLTNHSQKVAPTHCN